MHVVPKHRECSSVLWPGGKGNWCRPWCSAVFPQKESQWICELWVLHDDDSCHCSIVKLMIMDVILSTLEKVNVFLTITYRNQTAACQNTAPCHRMFTLMLLESVRNMVSRSMPMPQPAVGGSPYSSAVQNVSSMNMASSSPSALAWTGFNMSHWHTHCNRGCCNAFSNTR